MYDLSGSNSNDLEYVEKDWKEIQTMFSLFVSEENPTYLRHNGKPLVSLWGVGFNDGRSYSTSDVNKLVRKLKGPSNKVSIMLGVPYYWRTLGNDTEDNPALLKMIKSVDIIMPWAVGRYNIDDYDKDITKKDMEWAVKNNVDYVPLVFPGFTWGNLRKDPNLYNQIPREQGDFFWKQIVGAKASGAKSLYVAMFDEVDEGTAIYKVSRQNNVPLNGNDRFMFVGIEDDLTPDYYLWLTGQAANWFHAKGSYGETKPVR